MTRTRQLLASPGKSGERRNPPSTTRRRKGRPDRQARRDQPDLPAQVAGALAQLGRPEKLVPRARMGPLDSPAKKATLASQECRVRRAIPGSLATRATRGILDSRASRVSKVSGVTKVLRVRLVQRAKPEPLVARDRKAQREKQALRGRPAERVRKDHKVPKGTLARPGTQDRKGIRVALALRDHKVRPVVAAVAEAPSSRRLSFQSPQNSGRASEVLRLQLPLAPREPWW